jgi:hypothetical protein
MKLQLNKRVERLRRSIHPSQGIRLLERNDSLYKVYGSTGKVYNIHLNQESPGIICNCIDCKMNKGFCKHIYFIFVNVFKIIPDLDHEYTYTELKELDNKPCLESKPRNDECCICFACLSESIFTCSLCRNGFHNNCIHELRNRSE